VSPRGSVVLSRPVYQRWWGDRTVNRFHVTLAAGADVVDVRHRIATGVGAGLKVLTQRSSRVSPGRGAPRLPADRALELLPLVVAGLGLAEALLAVSLDRRREFALLRAAGATRVQVARAVVGESAGVGLLGLAGGLLIGAVLALLWVRFNFTYQLGWEIDFHFAGAAIPGALAAALLVSVPAGLMPARRIARLPVLEALRAE
jgi:putative ABC transport system permease protein